MSTQRDTKQAAPIQFTTAPEAVEAEELLLSNILLSGGVINEALAVRLEPDDFFIVRNGWIYAAMLDVRADGLGVDYMTTTARLRDQGRIDDIGGESYLMELTTRFSPGFSGPDNRAYATLIRRKAEARRLLEFCSTLATDIANHHDIPPVTHWAKATERLHQLRPYTGSEELLLGADSIAYADRAMEMDRANPRWFPLPWRAFENVAPVYKPGDILVMAGPEGSGKSAMAFNAAQFYAEEMQARVLYVFTEMDLENVLARRKAANSKLQYRRLLTPESLTDDEIAEYHRADVRIGEWSPRVDFWECGATSAKQLIAGLNSHVDAHGVDVVIIDGFNDLMFDIPRGETLPNTIHNFMAYLETWAREHDVLVIGTVQLNREGQALGSGSYKRKAALMLRIDVPKAETDESVEWEGVTYGTNAGSSSMFRKVHIEKNRRGASGGHEWLSFIGARFLWVDDMRGSLKGYDGTAESLEPVDFGGKFAS